MRRRCWPSTGLTCPTTATSAPWTSALWNLWTFLPAGSPARIRATVAHAPDFADPVLDSGANSPEPFARFDHAMSSWKTSQPSLFGDSTKCLGTWPYAGTMRRGVCAKHRRLAVPKSVAAYSLPPGESGSLFTSWMTSSDAKPAMTGFVRDALATLPTARALRREQWLSGLALSLRTNRGVMWRTPTANEDSAGRLHGNMQFMLTHAVKLCWQVEAERGGQLAPRFVEWLMGYPDGWTDCGDSGTPLSPTTP